MYGWRGQTKEGSRIRETVLVINFKIQYFWGLYKVSNYHIFFTQTKFKEKSCHAKMCEFSAIPNLQQSSVSDKYNKIYSKSLKDPYNTLIIHDIFITTTFALHFQKLLPKKECKIITTN